ncbi:hypothetical protein GLOTRDRAFT_137330 [Gloeophyllum trabeum ATCC 11539]|uniref:HNH nuclease domain-containing protein n=1 Tax=Gloeophyllum trabeum (strain ATCC 11539 / FP-39264 / Madison 617) TaxID=670483 RepID=S7RZ26_GLOTA|nr:uncharacterized protein GLOTRDRAFT_137330 [Gloeophyllum trabeum ATCC 11539]EPQ58694.1 hypothetical protein GLOTRDRAFT_137330 [Gloeophyllum trabeum ATCC 11539]
MPREANVKLSWAGATIERFGDISLKGLLGTEESIHSPRNIFIGNSTHHLHFDSLEVWFAPVKNAQGEVQPNLYDICCKYGASDLRALGFQQRVAFREIVMDRVHVPPPDARILALHAACARIAHLSGAAESCAGTLRQWL